MIALCSQLRTDFSAEPKILAIIFDSETAARNYNPAGDSYFVSIKLERGEYELDRIKKREYLYFSTKRGNP
jgi:hypothetical protein